VRVLITGARGFIGKNLALHLREQGCEGLIEFNRGDDPNDLPSLVARADAVIHLAGENRPKNVEDFAVVNAGLTQTLCEALRVDGRRIPFLVSSSAQAVLDNPYGLSKRGAERAVEQLAHDTGSPVAIYRLPGVFGKWCRPNYNSVVATFCHNIANDLPIEIKDPTAQLRLVYVDDVVGEFLRFLYHPGEGTQWPEVQPEHAISLGSLAAQIGSFKECRMSLVSERVGTGLVRALYATYVSYLPPSRFAYELPGHRDQRGVFVEMLKTQDSGQFSYFTAHPGVTRGGHYHHSKTEKFLVVKGKARFGFRHVLTGETFDLSTSGDVPQVVDSVPGWTHDITNIGEEELLVLLWANEVFDRDRPDTIACKV
jgi:UDP-2-acetamido-2,6-beta-L-arabino-hexul-4-ose reductase